MTVKCGQARPDQPPDRLGVSPGGAASCCLRFHGHWPSSSASSEKLRKVLTTTTRPSTPTLVNEGETVVPGPTANHALVSPGLSIVDDENCRHRAYSRRSYGFQIGVKPGVPGVLPAVGPPNALYALAFAFGPAWLLPGSSEVPAAGLMACTPLSPLCASALTTPCPTIGQRNGSAFAAPAVPSATAAIPAVSAKRLCIIGPPGCRRYEVRGCQIRLTRNVRDSYELLNTAPRSR